MAPSLHGTPCDLPEGSADTPRTAIRIRDLHKSFPAPRGLFGFLRNPLERPARIPALQGVSLEAGQGETLGLLGPNGAGKTTLIKILANLAYPNKGEVIIHGYDVKRHSLAVRKIVGYVPSDERSFFWRLTGRENLEFFASLFEIRPKEAGRRICDLLDRFELQSIADRRFATYSSGQKKLLTIIRGLLSHPRVLVMDEATNSLDPPTAKNVVRYLKDELVSREGCTLVWATHRLEEVHDICDQVVLIHKGKRRFLGSASEFAGTANRLAPANRDLNTLISAFEQLI